MRGRKQILVIGGSSKLAQSLRRILPDDSKYISRYSLPSHSDILVDDYVNADDQLFHDISVVINCVGTAKGSRQQLDRVNVNSAVANLEKAIAAGADHFIQISSFSVYGRAELIDKDTEEHSEGSYGKSKRKAEKILLRVAGKRISVSVLRLPMLYDVSSENKLLSLLKLWHKVKFLPVPRRPVLRSMMSYDLAAKIVGNMIENRSETTILTAADPEPFDYQKVSTALGLSSSISFRTLSLPNFLFKVMKIALPATYNSLFRNSVVSPRHNYAVTIALKSTLYNDIRLMMNSGEND
ncbi:MAG: NAD-dependent epimerase/dehydratase family protein [Parasphingorhabdus sp.]